MLRIGAVTILIAGLFVSLKAFTNKPTANHSHYKISSLKAEHGCDGPVQASDDYQLVLFFEQELTSPANPSLSFKKKNTELRCSNPISNIRIFSTEKINEANPAGKDISALFDFHYVRTLQTKYGTMIKEGVFLPVSEFENMVDQDMEARQFRELRLKLVQKPILESDLRFIVQVVFENGEVKSDTTECINFEGLRTAE